MTSDQWDVTLSRAERFRFPTATDTYQYALVMPKSEISFGQWCFGSDLNLLGAASRTTAKENRLTDNSGSIQKGVYR